MSEQPIRWYTDGYWGQKMSSDDVEIVLATDYDALQSRLDAAEAESKRLRLGFYQQVSDSDLQEIAAFVSDDGLPKKCLFFVPDAHRLANTTLHMVREVQRLRQLLAERDALLRDAIEDAKCFLASDAGWKRYGNQRDEIEARYDAALLSASAEPVKLLRAEPCKVNVDDPIGTPYLMFCLGKWWPCSERQLNAAKGRNYPVIDLASLLTLLSSAEPVSAEPQPTGYDQLWGWFGLSYAAWLTLPRILMHEMPDDWQAKMAQLLEQWDETWDTSDLPCTQVTGVRSNRFVAWPSWLMEYRHPNNAEIEAHRAKPAKGGDGEERKWL